MYETLNGGGVGGGPSVELSSGPLLFELHANTIMGNKTKNTRMILMFENLSIV